MTQKETDGSVSEEVRSLLTSDQQSLLESLGYIKTQISIELIPDWAIKIVRAELTRRDTAATISELLKGIKQLSSALRVLQSISFFSIEQLHAYLINVEDSISYKLSEVDDDGTEPSDESVDDTETQSMQMSPNEYLAYELAWLQHNLAIFLSALSEAQELLESQHDELIRLVQRLNLSQIRDLQSILNSKPIKENFVPMSALLRSETSLIQ